MIIIVALLAVLVPLGVIEMRNYIGRLKLRQEEQLEALSHSDAVTGVASRLTWDAEVPRELSRSSRDNSPMCLALVEIDGMKIYIHENGAEGARRFLKSATAKWVECLRASDLLARYTRDDFGVLLPGCDIDKASTVINRLCAATPEGRTCSAGVTHWDESEPASVLVERAERALKEAQDAGRNRVVVLEAPLEASTDAPSPTQR